MTLNANVASMLETIHALASQMLAGSELGTLPLFDENGDPTVDGVSVSAAEQILEVVHDFPKTVSIETPITRTQNR